MPRKQKKYHYIYKTICLVNQKYYIGMHSTSNLEDEYFGSGKILKRSLNKYGKENHKLEILEMLEDRLSLKDREREIVNEDLLKDPLNMNLQLGGGGGLSTIEHANKFHSSGGSVVIRKMRMRHIEKLEDPEYREKWMNAVKLGKKKANAFGFNGRNHTTKTIEKMRETHRGLHEGKKNSQFGTIWITDGSNNKKIKKNELIQNGWKKGRKIK